MTEERSILRIPVRAPFPWKALLEYLSFRLIPGIERVEHDRYVRETGSRPIEVSFDEENGSLLAKGVRPAEESATAARIANLFDVQFQFDPIQMHLAGLPLFERRIAKVPGMRPLGAWNPFELCVRTILGQQVTVAAAGTLMRRWVERCGAITPSCVLAADLTSIGMPNKRVEFIRALARGVLEQEVKFELPWSEVDSVLKSLPGFGPWTRAYLAIRLGREPDALPASDLGLIRAANVNTPAELSRIAEAWRPFRSYAATYLWAVGQE